MITKPIEIIKEAYKYIGGFPFSHAGVRLGSYFIFLIIFHTFLDKKCLPILFFMGKDQYDNLYLESSLRTASSLGFGGGLDLKYQGLRGGINLIYNNKELFKDIKLIFGVNAGVYFADSLLNAFLYDVEPEYTTPERNYYESDSG